MKENFLPLHLILLTLASLAASCQTAWANEGSANPANINPSSLDRKKGDENTSHWGLGLGAGAKGLPYKGDRTKITPVPLIYFDNNRVHLLGTTVDLTIANWHGIRYTLRGKFSLGDGYQQSDAPILNGMASRHGAFWYGPAIAWHTGFGVFSGDYLTSGSKGQRAELTFGKSFDLGDFSVFPHLGLEWLGSRYVDYYYGVRASEARADRSAYTGDATWNTSVGARFGYRLTEHQRLILDIGVSHLGSGITDSPLVGKRYMSEAAFGYLYKFK